MAIAFARPTLFNTLSSRFLTTRTTTAPPSQTATIVRPFNPFGLYRPPFAPFLPPPVVPKPVLIAEPKPVLIAAPAPPPVKPEGECQTCKGTAPAPAPAPTPAPSFALVEKSTAAEPESPAPTPATPAGVKTEAPRSTGKVVGFVIAAGVLIALLVYGSHIRPR